MIIQVYDTSNCRVLMDFGIRRPRLGRDVFVADIINCLQAIRDGPTKCSVSVPVDVGMSDSVVGNCQNVEVLNYDNPSTSIIIQTCGGRSPGANFDGKHMSSTAANDHNKSTAAYALALVHEPQIPHKIAEELMCQLFDVIHVLIWSIESAVERETRRECLFRIFSSFLRQLCDEPLTYILLANHASAPQRSIPEETALDLQTRLCVLCNSVNCKDDRSQRAPRKQTVLSAVVFHGNNLVTHTFPSSNLRQVASLLFWVRNLPDQSLFRINATNMVLPNNLYGSVSGRLFLGIRSFADYRLALLIDSESEDWPDLWSPNWLYLDFFNFCAEKLISPSEKSKQVSKRNHHPLLNCSLFTNSVLLRSKSTPADIPPLVETNNSCHDGPPQSAPEKSTSSSSSSSNNLFDKLSSIRDIFTISSRDGQDHQDDHQHFQSPDGVNDHRKRLKSSLFHGGRNHSSWGAAANHFHAKLIPKSRLLLYDIRHLGRRMSEDDSIIQASRQYLSTASSSDGIITSPSGGGPKKSIKNSIKKLSIAAS